MAYCAGELTTRGVLHLSGKDASAFLQGIVTQDVRLVTEKTGIWAGILSPQGKYQGDFILHSDGQEGYWMEMEKSLLPEVKDILQGYKLRSKVEIADCSEEKRVGVLWEEEGNTVESDIGIPDPRLNALGRRVVGSSEEIKRVLTATGAFWEEDEIYRAHRIACGVPELGQDLQGNEIYWLEAQGERFQGVSFTKGCYVGQEVTARMKHKDALKRSIIPVTLMGFTQAPCLLKTDVWEVGTLLAISGMQGLALVRLDRWKDAEISMRSIMAGDTFLIPRTVSHWASVQGETEEPLQQRHQA